jgi:hypothetical protein
MIGCPLLVNSEVQMSQDLGEKELCFTVMYRNTKGIATILNSYVKNKEKLKSETGENIFTKPIYISGSKNDIQLEVALVWNAGYQEQIVTFTNNIPQKDGGTHLSGFKNALTRTLNNYIEIWRKIETYIGSQWFQLSFGIFMKKYFIEQLNISSEPTVLCLNNLFREINTNLWTLNDYKCNDYIRNIIISELKKIKNPKFDKYIKKIIGNIDKIFDLTSLIFETSPTILWNIEEDKWENKFEDYIKNYKLRKYISYAKKYAIKYIPNFNNISSVHDLLPIINDIYDELEELDEWVDDIENNFENYIHCIRLHLKEHIFLPIF